MVTNIFTYATKELSQDAFICWLLVNHDVEELQEESYRFLNLLMDTNFANGDIKQMTIKQQERKIDIVIDFWTSVSKSYDSHYVLVIEDKTTSSAHDEQLVNYNQIIDGWNKNEIGFELRTKKVFFKSNILSPQDEREISKANDNTFIKWKKLDLDDLHEGYKYLVLEVVIKRTSTDDNHTLDNTDDFYLENDHAKQNVDRYYGYTSFNSIKPVNDYSWIGMKINDIREYDFTLLLEVPSTFNFEEQLSFLEVDFFIGKNADSILIR